VKRDSLSSTGEVAVYVPMRQRVGFDAPAEMSLVVRAGGSPDALAGQLRAAVAQVDATVPVSAGRPLRALVSESASRTRSIMLLLTAFASVALALGAVGIYGVVAYAVAGRTREIGVRMALGARATDVLGMVLREGGTLVAVGVVIGIAGALAAGRLLAGFLFGVAPSDPAVFMAVPLLLGAVALGACLVPAMRAARVDPVVALRSD
jgi:predicted lysophospholipase L1 biosynthesis ABC-type transport system permease subunit